MTESEDNIQSFVINPDNTVIIWTHDDRRYSGLLDEE